MPRKLTEVVDEIVSRYEAAAPQYSIKQVEDDVRAVYDAGEVTEDPVDEQIRKAVKARDKISRNDPQGQLMFAEFTFPRSLVLDDNERQPTAAAKLQHVLADQAVKQTNKIRQDLAFLRLQQRNLALLPYLQQGLTVSMAVDAWQRDHPDE